MTDKKLNIKSMNIRSYPKIIVLWPLLVESISSWILLSFFKDVFYPLSTAFCIGWFFLFFIGLFAMAYDMQAGKTTIIVLSISIVILMAIMLGVFSFFLDFIAAIVGDPNTVLPTYFYFVTSVMLTFILGFVWVGAHFDYYKIERNEMWHKTGIIFKKSERFPTSALRYEKEITDIWEKLICGAGSIILIPKSSRSIHLDTVVGVKSKFRKLDLLLSHLQVETDQMDRR